MCASDAGVDNVGVCICSWVCMEWCETVDSGLVDDIVVRIDLSHAPYILYLSTGLFSLQNCIILSTE